MYVQANALGVSGSHAVEAHAASALKDGRCQKGQLKAVNFHVVGQRIIANDMLFASSLRLTFEHLLEYNRHSQQHGSLGSGLFLHIDQNFQ